MITLEALYEEANEFLWNNYKMTLDIPIEIESLEEFPLAEGWFEHTGEEACRIVITQTVQVFADDDVALDVLRHELIHYALFRLNRNFSDGEDDFEAELKRLNVSGSETTMIGIYFMYKCNECGGEIPHHEKLEDWQMVRLNTYCCDAQFTDMKRQAIYTGKERIY